ncbi:MAG: Ig-like domain-containing protein, partial [Planctomycetota bacterium]
MLFSAGTAQGVVEDIYEAEDATLVGPTINTGNAGYTGSGYVNYVNNTGDYIEWTVTAASAGSWDLWFRYGQGDTDRPLEIKVNGQVVAASFSFPNTGGWGVWDITALLPVTLNAGANTVRATTIGFEGPNIDHLAVGIGGPQNHPPGFTSDPINERVATEDAAYSGTIADDASDWESDPMTFSKVSGPAWLSVASDGTLSGTPATGDIGDNVFTVQVDATGGSDTATLNITVIDAASNQAPSFTSDTFNATSVENAVYVSTLADDASDPESDPMTFSKVSGPAWLIVAADGALSGTPGAGDIGDNVFTVQVDATGGSDTATLNIAVEAALPYPAEKFMGSWGPRFMLPASPGWNEYQDTWDVAACAAQFNQLTSAKYIFVNVTAPAGGHSFTSPNPPLAAAVPELAGRFPTRDVLVDTLDLIQASGREAFVYFACEGFSESDTLNTPFTAYVQSQLGPSATSVDGVVEYLIKYYAQKFGDKIDGWWFDGSSQFNETQKQEVKDAVRSGNPNAVVTYGTHMLQDFQGGHPTLRTIAPHWSYDYNYRMITRIETGPWLDIDYLPVAGPADGFLGHTFMAMQANWTGGSLAFPAWQAADWCSRVVNAGGMHSWAIPTDYPQSGMQEDQFQLARLVNTVIGGDKFIADSFETDFGAWIDGGTDCSYYTGSYASHGADAIELTGNSSSSLMSTGDLPMNGSSTATVGFGFYATGFGSGDTFELQISANGGSSYSTVETWTYGTDFANDEHNNDIKHLEGYSFNDQTRFRFRCYASSGSVYIDDIKVNAITTNPPPSLPVDHKPVFIADPIIKYFRNYAKEGYDYSDRTYAKDSRIVGSAVDADGDTLTYSKVAGPA